MATGSALPQTLNSITATKINELAKQRGLFESRKASILVKASEQKDLRDRVRVLLEGVTRVKGHPADALEDDSEDEDVVYEMTGDDLFSRGGHMNMRRFLLQSKYDPSLSTSLLQRWESALRDELEILSVKHQHSLFFSKLVTEWLQSPDLQAPEPDSLAVEDSSSFEEIGRNEMHEQRSTWEELVFKPLSTDPDAITAYLTDLFCSTKVSKQALKELREKVKNFGKGPMMDPSCFDVQALNWVVGSLTRADLLSDEKIKILKEFIMNESVAQEVVDVLNMRMAALDTWSWGDAVPLEMRRYLNGKYRVFMDEDILDALFLHFIGIKWCTQIKELLTEFSNQSWKSASGSIPQRDLERRKYFLNETRPSETTVDQERKLMYFEDYFMSHLPNSEDEGARSYDDNDEDDEDVAANRKSPIETKHSLLHLLITESHVNTTLHGQFTVVRSDFKWFGPSLPHSSIMAVLKFFGFQDDWLDFFTRFLEAPVKFVQDGPKAGAQVRKRGVPMSHSISDLFSELTLFSMDYAVNQHAHGTYLYRLHDDFWVWGSEQRCVEAWTAMERFSKLMGLEFNEEKTGTVRLGEKNEEVGSDSVTDPLPQGEIRWGFLRLDAESGRFLIDQSLVDTHIEELRRQLGARKSVFSWVQAWNSYLSRFFSNNFGRPAQCFGRQHIEMVISTLSRIEHELFADGPAGQHSVTDYLRQIVADRFDEHDLPDGFFYFPVEMGGLELRNPFVPFLAMRENMKRTPRKRLERAFIQEEQAYNDLKERFEKHGSSYVSISAREVLDAEDLTAFMPLDEYTRHRESQSPQLLRVYKDLLEVPVELGLEQTPEVNAALKRLRPLSPSSTKIGGPWNKVSPYWKWIGELYCQEMERKFGGLRAVEKNAIPLGIVKVLQQGKIKWQG